MLGLTLVSGAPPGSVGAGSIGPSRGLVGLKQNGSNVLRRRTCESMFDSLAAAGANITGMYSAHAYDVCRVCALRLSPQSTPRSSRHRHLLDLSLVDNPGEHAPVSCPLMPYDASNSPLSSFSVARCALMARCTPPPAGTLVPCTGVLTAAPLPPAGSTQGASPPRHSVPSDTSE